MEALTKRLFILYSRLCAAKVKYIIVVGLVVFVGGAWVIVVLKCIKIMQRNSRIEE